MLRSTANRVECNYHGMRADGVTAKKNRRGVDIIASDNLVGTEGQQPALGRRNLISATCSPARHARNAPSRNIICRQIHRRDASGTLSRSNLHGVSINGAGNGSTALDKRHRLQRHGTPEFARKIIAGMLAGSGNDGGQRRAHAIAGNFIGWTYSAPSPFPTASASASDRMPRCATTIIGFASGQRSP